jgi:hypothetical protein
MLQESTAQPLLQPVYIFHPITSDLWDISPLLQVLHELGANEPNRMAESMYDIGRYIVAEQYSPQDTSARLRQMVGRVEQLAVAFDSIQVRATASARPLVTMRISS